MHTLCCFPDHVLPFKSKAAFPTNYSLKAVSNHNLFHHLIKQTFLILEITLLQKIRKMGQISVLVTL